MSTYGIAILVAIELYKKWRDPWYEPHGPILLNVFKSAFSYKDPRNMSEQERKEHFCRSFIKQDRDLYGVDSFYRVHNIVSLAELLAVQMDYEQAEAWYQYALRLIKHNYGEDNRYAHLLVQLAQIKRKRNHSVASLELLERALAIFESNLKAGGIADDTSIKMRLEVFTLQAEILHATGDYKGCVAAMAATLTLLQDQGDFASDALYHYLSKIITCARLAGDDVLVSRYQQQRELILAVVLGEQGLGQDSPYLSRDLNALADFYSKNGRTEFTLTLRKRAKALSLLGRFSGVDYPGIEHDLAFVADWLKERATGADGTVAFHLERRIKRIQDKRSRKF